MLFRSEHYASGGLFQRDKKKAAYWYEKAADQGYPEAEEKLKKLKKK